jgi:hypothetical protein
MITPTRTNLKDYVRPARPYQTHPQDRKDSSLHPLTEDQTSFPIYGLELTMVASIIWDEVFRQDYRYKKTGEVSEKIAWKKIFSSSKGSVNIPQYRAFEGDYLDFPLQRYTKNFRDVI